MNADKRSTDDWARDVLAGAVGDVEPADRLAAIRARTAGRRRRSWPVVGGTVLATAATVVAALVVWQLADPDEDAGPDPAVPGETVTVPVYFVGDTPRGPRLYREFQQVQADRRSSDLTAPALEAMMAGPDDPDYRTLWQPGDLDTSVNVDGSDPPSYGVPLLDPTLTDRPASMTPMDADLAVQQLIYTIQATAGLGPVAVYHEQERVPLLGIGYESRSVGLARHSENRVLAFVNISDPAEGVEVGDTMVARGRANSFEANVPWRILDFSGETVLDGFATAEGWGDRLYPWRTEIDVSGLDPGEYTFVVQTDDASGGTEGAGPHTDTRTFVVR